jgi:hypothetical protein
MPIEGERRDDHALIPVIINGERRLITKDYLKPYDLDSAQDWVNGIRKGLDAAKDTDSWLDQHTIVELEKLVHTIDEVIAAGHRELDRIQAKRAHLHSKEAVVKYDDAINRLRTGIDRHVRMRTRVQTVLQRARAALAQQRVKSRSVPRETRSPADY